MLGRGGRIWFKINPKEVGMVEVWIQKGGPIMYPLLICSFLSIILIVERALFWLVQSFTYRSKALSKALSLVQQGQKAKAKELLTQTKDSVAKVLLVGLESSSPLFVQQMEVVASKQIAQMRRFLPIMNTLIMLTPLLGILGTVIGIIHSFEVLGSSAIANPKGVTQGVAEALITTAFGLTIAIWTLIPYNHFSQKVERVQTRTEQFATQLEVVLQEGSTKSL